MKLISWNVNGIRAGIKKGFEEKYAEMDADLFCIQETKAQDDQVAEALTGIGDRHIYSHSAVKKGYSGVAVISKKEALNVSHGIGVEQHDQEGRVITLEYDDFYLVNVYVPNSGSGLKRLEYRSEWDRDFATYLKVLNGKKSTIVTGDFNVAHEAIDLARPKANYNKTSGYTQTEIDGMNGLLEVGFIDSFRKLHPEKVQYTFWSQRFGARAKNVGWRIDYFLVASELEKKMKSAFILDQVMGSDHCPLGLEMDL